MWISENGTVPLLNIEQRGNKVRKSIIFIAFISFLAIPVPRTAFAEITLTKPTQTIKLSNLGELLDPKILKITKAPNGEGYGVEFAYQNYIFEGIIPGVISFKTILSDHGTAELREHVFSVVILEKYIDSRDIICLSSSNYCGSAMVQFRISNEYADTRNKLALFFTPQMIKGILYADKFTQHNNRLEDIVNITIYPSR